MSQPLANLIVRPEKLGDLIVATPVFRAFKESFPDQPLHLLTDEVFAEVVRHDPHLDKIITIRWKGRERGQREPWWSIYRKLSVHRYERAALFYYNVEMWNWLMAALRVKHVAQLGGTYSSFLLGHKRVMRRMYEGRMHFSGWYLKVAQLLGTVAVPMEPKVYLLPEEKKAFDARFPWASDGRLRVFLHPFGYGSSPNMNEAMYVALAERLIKELGAEVQLSGSTGDAKSLREKWPDMVRRDWLGTLSLREWAIAAQRSSLVICGSTGVAHVASAVGAPLLGIYCPFLGSHPDIWGPIGPKAHVVVAAEHACRKMTPQTDSPCDGGNCNLGAVLGVEKVFHAAREIIEQGGHPASN